MSRNIIFVLLIFFGVVVFYSCGHRPSEGSRKAGKHIESVVSASVETTPTPQRPKDDSADDPAIWIDSQNPEESFIIGTDKKGGLATYNLTGLQLNYYPYGKMNNCDVRYGFPLENDTIDILAASNRSTHSLSLYKISKGGVLDSIHSRIIKSAMYDDVYGLCMYKSEKTGNFYVFMNSKAGEVEQYHLFASGEKIEAKLVRSFAVNTQTEGMVADDEKGILYLGEEVNGIWKFDAEPDGHKVGKIIANSSEENNNIRYDLEGLAIYNTGNGNGYLLASSQGNYSYAIFEREGDNKYLGSFRIVDGELDGVEETDGIEVTNVSLPGFPNGFLVVQDGYNYDVRKKKSQNFKLISWEAIEKVIGQ